MAALHALRILIALLLVTPSSFTPQSFITIFPTNVRSERDLPVCATPTTVCSVVQKRYWLPAVLYRYCRCAERADCPSDWAGMDDARPVNVTAGLGRVKLGIAYSMLLNNRAQMKFCTSIQSMERCTEEPGIVQQVVSFNGTANLQTQANCTCPTNSAWQRFSSVGEEGGTSVYYSCKPLKRCKPRSTCGTIATDTFSIYPQCLCRRGSVCTVDAQQRGNNLTLAEELYYSGPAYSGICKP